MRYIFPLLILSLLTANCHRKIERPNDDVVVRVGNNFLSNAEIKESLPENLSKEDSLIVSEKIIQLWIKDNLLFEHASKNVADKEEIKQLVESYRKSLIIYQYQEQLINEKLSKEIGEGEMMKYYEEHKNKFKLDKTLIKGLLLKIPVGAPQINDVREWYKSSSQSAISKIEKYSVQNAKIYDYFYDKWVDFNELMDNIPVHYDHPESVVKNNKNIEISDSSYHYFLHIEAYLLQGDDAPFEYAQPTVRELLINQRKMEFLRKVEDDLYNSALSNGKIQFYSE